MPIIKKTNGFSLLEVMLAVLIMSMIAVFALRMQGPKFRQAMVDHASAQMKQIMEAATSYYIDNGQWPVNQAPTIGQPYGDLGTASILLLTDTSGKGNAAYLPTTILSANNTFMSPFGTSYQAGPNPSQTYFGPGDSATFFEVSVDTQDPQTAILLKAKLPVSYITPGTAGGKNTVVTAYLSIPSYDYNHAQAVSDVGVYNPGDCIPRPSYACPNGLVAATFVTLEQSYGFATPVSTPSGDQNSDKTIYPITGSSAYVMTGTNPDGTPVSGGAPQCPNIIAGSQGGSSANPHSVNITCPANQDRVCVDINTLGGAVRFNTPRTQDTYVLAITKCAPKND